MERDGIVGALEELAALSELLGENPFKVRAYANAARTLSKTSQPVEEWARPGVLEALPGVGKAIAEKVREGLATGSMHKLEELRAKVPEGVKEILGVQGLGPRKAGLLWRQLGILSAGELEYACIENRLLALPGFGPKTQAKVLEGVRLLADRRGKLLLPSALGAQAALRARLEGGLARTAWLFAGEAARLCPVVSRLELAVETARAAEAAALLGLSEAAPGRFEGRSPEGCPIDLWASAPESLGAAAVWASSGEAFREALRRELAAAGLSWSQRGLEREGRSVPAPSEAAFWRAAGRAPVPPECRELPEALAEDLSDLVAEGDLRGAFHVHTDWSDGGATLETMVTAAEALGWEYVGLCDHSASAVYAHGLDSERLMAQRAAIAEAQTRHPGIALFAGVESDILGGGELDYSDELLATLDLVVASVHSRFGLDEEAQTERLVRAVSHPATTMLGHPTGRLLLSREPYPHRWEEVEEALMRAGAAVELNANPHRLDVDWTRLPSLRRRGLPVAINPDAHSVAGLVDVGYGIWAARKGLARRSDILNALGREAVGAWLRSRKAPRG